MLPFAMTGNSNDIKIKIKLTLEEMYSGVTKKIKYKRNKSCHCNSSGNCTKCSNKGFLSEESIEEIKIPTGIAQGMVLQFNKKGHFFIEKKPIWKIFSGSKSDPENNFGNLIVTIEEIKHHTFSRNGADLVYNCALNKSELNETDKIIEIQHLNKETIKIKIPKNTVNGKVFRIKGKGFKKIAENQAGSLLIVSKIIDG